MGVRPGLSPIRSMLQLCLKSGFKILRRSLLGPPPTRSGSRAYYVAGGRLRWGALISRLPTHAPRSGISAGSCPPASAGVPRVCPLLPPVPGLLPLTLPSIPGTWLSAANPRGNNAPASTTRGRHAPMLGSAESLPSSGALNVKKNLTLPCHVSEKNEK